MTSILIVVDYQNDFVESSGALYVPSAEELGERIEHLSELYEHIVLTQDWHTLMDPSFKSNGGLWPAHCVATSWGAALSGRIPRTHERAMAIFRKRKNSALADNLGLARYLDGFPMPRADLCGVALDYCVKETAIDLARFGFDVNVVYRATKAVDPEADNQTVTLLEQGGVRVI